MAGLTPSIAQRVNKYLERTGLKSVAPLEVIPSDASMRRYVRVVISSENSRMLVVYPGSIDTQSLSFLNVSQLLDKMSIPVPTIINTEADLGIIELEDLGNLSLQNALSSASLDYRETLYLEAITIIANLQHRARSFETSNYVPFKSVFDTEKLMWEFDFFLDHFLICARGVNLSPEQRSALRDEFVPLASELAAEPRVLCHRDYHSRNLMLHNNRLYVIDFQDARMGPDTYDLVSLLRDSYIENPADLIETMIGKYLELAKTANVALFRQRFDLMSVQRHLKALGTFGYQSAIGGSSRYDDDIPRTLRYLIEVFDRRERFTRLRKLLSPHLRELG